MVRQYTVGHTLHTAADDSIVWPPGVTGWRNARWRRLACGFVRSSPRGCGYAGGKISACCLVKHSSKLRGRASTASTFTALLSTVVLPLMLWRRWLGGRKGIWPVKIWVVRNWHGYLSGARCKWFAYCPADASATPWSLAPVKSRMVYVSGARLPRLSWKRPLNRCSSTWILLVAADKMFYVYHFNAFCDIPEEDISSRVRCGASLETSLEHVFHWPCSHQY